MHDGGDDGFLARPRGGDREAFAELVRRHHHDLLAANRTMPEAGQAEEAVQDAWVVAGQRRRTVGTLRRLRPLRTATLG